MPANLLSPSEFRALVSGERRGVAAKLLRGLLRIAEVPYTLVVGMRNRRFDRGAGVEHVPAPVISVGNLTLGGTGKTPMVEWLARWLREHDLRATIVSRGYGVEAGARNDEALELEQRLPDVPHLQNPDRVEAARTAIEELEAQVIVLDDGFQHRRLARDLDIVLIDALDPYGGDHVFPRGMLREPLVNLARADVVALARADMVDEAMRADIRKRLTSYAREAAWIEVVHAPQYLLASTGERQPIETLQGKRVAAFCGLGNPAGFRHTLDRLGCHVVDFAEFPDHHPYGRADVEGLARRVEEQNVEMVLCTHKDLVKIGIDRLGNKPLMALVIGLEIIAGREEFEERLEAVLPVT